MSTLPVQFHDISYISIEWNLFGGISLNYGNKKCLTERLENKYLINHQQFGFKKIGSSGAKTSNSTRAGKPNYEFFIQ